MADRILAKYGQGEGPWVATSNFRKPALEVTGYEEGGVLSVTGDDGIQVEIAGNGKHPLNPATFMRIAAQAGKNLICRIAEA